MEYANHEILNLRYTKEKKIKKWTSFIKKHKTMSFIIASTIVLIGINSLMIHVFFMLLSSL